MGEKIAILLIFILLIVVWLIPMSILCETYNNTNKIRANQTKIIKNQIVITKAIKAVLPEIEKQTGIENKFDPGEILVNLPSFERY